MEVSMGVENKNTKHMLTLLPKWKLYHALQKGIVYITLFVIIIKHDIFRPFGWEVIDHINLDL